MADASESLTARPFDREVGVEVDFKATAKLTNDLCVPVKYTITDAEKSKAEAVIVDTISLIPGFDQLFNLLTVKSIMTNYVGFWADVTGWSGLQTVADFLGPEKTKEGWLYPGETVERGAALDKLYAQNVVKVEYLSLNEAKTAFQFSTFITKSLPDDTQLKVSDILKDTQPGNRPQPVDNPPEPWKTPQTHIISLAPDPNCPKKYRLLRIPNLRLERGQCQLSAWTSEPDGVFCSTTPRNLDETEKEIYPYTFTSSALDGTVLARGDDKQSMMYFNGPSGRQGGCWQVLLGGCIPVVLLNNCNIKKENQDPERFRAQGKRNVEDVLNWLWGEMKDRWRHNRPVVGTRYWAISWDRSNYVYGLDATSDAALLGKYVLVKKTGYYTFMVCDRWTSLQ
ncbi:uncharacterized protein B0T15DRAFT_490109 [Chaetomium strumarium]|uniref:Uncharacterized protein n=1 Tax=Chaetomium strumarium TaxID=1170767 RepID=A0AAJ0H4B9_9PEZI|nr:hypothetical protein B0T15DRAFT_490109 [Chaetomium strumarium]